MFIVPFPIIRLFRYLLVARDGDCKTDVASFTLFHRIIVFRLLQRVYLMVFVMFGQFRSVQVQDTILQTNRIGWMEVESAILP